MKSRNILARLAMVASFTVALTGNRLYAKEGGGPSNLPAQSGAYYQDTVPDTLDLAERARLGLSYFTGLLDPKLGYEMPLTCNFSKAQPPYMVYNLNSIGTCQAKALEVMAYLRLMTGSKKDLDREKGMIDMMVSNLGEDGLYWVPGSPDKPWLGIQEPFAATHGQARMMRAMIAWYQYSGDPVWKTRIDRMVNGLDRTFVVHKDNVSVTTTTNIKSLTSAYGDHLDLNPCFLFKGRQDMPKES